MNDHPEVQTNFADRVARAQEFCRKYSIPFRVYIDPWGDPFETLFHVWPDKYHIIENGKITGKSEYGMNAVIITDYADLLGGTLSAPLLASLPAATRK